MVLDKDVENISATPVDSREGTDLHAFQQAFLRQAAQWTEKVFELLKLQEQRLVTTLEKEIEAHFATLKGFGGSGKLGQLLPQQQQAWTSGCPQQGPSVLTAIWGDAGGGNSGGSNQTGRASAAPPKKSNKARLRAAGSRPGSGGRSRPGSGRSTMVSNYGDEAEVAPQQLVRGVSVASKTSRGGSAAKTAREKSCSRDSAASAGAYLLPPGKALPGHVQGQGRTSSESAVVEDVLAYDETEIEVLPCPLLSLSSTTSPEGSCIVSVFPCPRASSGSGKLSDASPKERRQEGEPEQEREPPVVQRVRTMSPQSSGSSTPNAADAKSVRIRACQRAGSCDRDADDSQGSEDSNNGGDDGDHVVKKVTSQEQMKRAATFDDTLPLELDPGDDESSESEDDDDDELDDFVVASIWAPGFTKGGRKSIVGIGSVNVRNDKANRNRMKRQQTGTLAMTRYSRVANCVRDLVIMKPYSKRRIGWEFISFLLLSYDIITIPLEVYEPAITIFTKVMTWVIRIFWTLDILVSLCSAFINREGETVVAPKLIAKNYLSRQFPLDILVVTTDWIEALFDGMRAGSVLKSWRMLRIARVLRLQKFRMLLQTVSEYMGSQKWLIVAGILRIMVVMLLLVHIVSCLWYVVGRIEEGGWARDMKEASLQERYLLCFHFAIAIFNGEHTRMPNNQLERTFVVVVLYVSFMGQTWIVSSITTRMTHLEMISARQSKLFHDLDKFLTGHSITRELSLKVTRNAQHGVLEQERNAKESKIELLQLISQPLMTELHWEIYSPTLSHHPFLRCYSEVSPAGVRKLCHTAAQKIFILQGDIVFHSMETTPCPKMLLIIAGTLSYQRENHDEDAIETKREVNNKNWIAEANLWCPDWIHCGTLQATADCTLLVLDAKVFQDTLGPYNSTETYEYATWFINRLNGQREEFCTDIGEYDPGMGQCLTKLFPNQRHIVESFQEGTMATRISMTRSGIWAGGPSIAERPAGASISGGGSLVTSLVSKVTSRSTVETFGRVESARSTQLTDARNTEVRTMDIVPTIGWSSTE